MRLTEALDFYNSNANTKQHTHFVPSLKDQEVKKEYSKFKRNRRKRKMKQDPFT